MKQFSNYQHVEGEPMNDRDKKEVGSKFWNKGKWDNFVLPFLPEDCSEMSLIDVGCNAGVFLKLAEDKGFSYVAGIESDSEAIRKGQRFRRRVGGKWKFRPRDIRDYIDGVPAVDYTVLAMAHYYFPIEDWYEYLEKLKLKSRYCIIVTANKKPKIKRAASDSEGIIKDMKHWELVDEIPELPLEGDPFPRRQWSFCFKNPDLERIPVDSIDNGNAQQRDFLEELDKGIKPLETKYYKRYKDYRRKTTSGQKVWTEAKLERYMNFQAELYEDIKKNGLKTPIIVDGEGRIRDGNHRHNIMKHLGYKSIIIKRV